MEEVGVRDIVLGLGCGLSIHDDGKAVTKFRLNDHDDGKIMTARGTSLIT